MGDELTLEERTIARLERRVLELERQLAALAKREESLRKALLPLARCVPWLPDGTEDCVHLGTQLRGLDNDFTPSIGECRHAAQLLKG